MSGQSRKDFVNRANFPAVYAAVPPALPLTSQRLGVVAASTELPAGGKLPNLHCIFCGLLPPLRQTASLAAGTGYLQESQNNSSKILGKSTSKSPL
jgi:hypothetical protein